MATARSAIRPGLDLARANRALLVVVAVALIVRLLVVATNDLAPANDAADYDRHARSIAAGDGFAESTMFEGPTATRAPAYPYFLGGIYALTGGSETAGLLANTVLGAFAVALIYLIARRIWGERVAIAAGGIAAVFPPLVFLSLPLLTEPLFLVFELGAVLALLRYRDSDQDLRWAVAAGLLAGLAAVTRANGLILLAVVALAALIAAGPLRRRLVTAGIASLAGLLVIAPWTIRNAIELDAFIPITTHSAFAAGTYNDAARTDPVHTGGYRPPRTVPELQPIIQRQGIGEAEAVSEMSEHALNYALDHPGYVIKVTWLNTLRVFEVTELPEPFATGQREERSLGDGAKAALMQPSALVLAALALLGIAVIVSRRSEFGWGPWYIWAIALLTILTTVPVDGRPRYRAAIDPFMIMLAAVALVWGWERLRARWQQG